jgi:uncharacterized protein
MFSRHLQPLIFTFLESSPVVLLVGPRQSGKTTTITKIGQAKGYEIVSFDSIVYQAAALEDPVGFIDARKKPVILDEVQRVPQIFLPIKVDVDKNRDINGRYILTGSANPLLVPKLGDALTGRMLLLQMWPLSQGELIGKEESFLERVFTQDFGYSEVIPFSRKELIQKVCLGGFPGMVLAKNEQGRRAWCDSYLSLAMQKDVQELAQIEGLSHMPKLLQIVATRVGSTLNYSELSNSTNIPLTSLRRYMQLLHSLFLLHSIPAWSRNLGKRLTKAPKVYFIDTGILLHTLNFDENRLEDTPSVFGGVAENFVVNELCKQITWAEKKRVKIYYCRLSDNRSEVDMVLEDERGKVIGIEVKSGETIKSDDFKHLKQLKELVGDDFLRGIVLYSGKEKVPFGSGNWAVPISDLWK